MSSTDPTPFELAVKVLRRDRELALGELLEKIGFPGDWSLPGRLVDAGMAEIRVDPTNGTRKLIRATPKCIATKRTLAAVDDEMHVARGALLAALEGQRHGQPADTRSLAKRLQALMDEREGILRRKHRGWLAVGAL